MLVGSGQQRLHTDRGRLIILLPPGTMARSFSKDSWMAYTMAAEDRHLQLLSFFQEKNSVTIFDGFESVVLSNAIFD